MEPTEALLYDIDELRALAIIMREPLARLYINMYSHQWGNVVILIHFTFEEPVAWRLLQILLLLVDLHLGRWLQNPVPIGRGTSWWEATSDRRTFPLRGQNEDRCTTGQGLKPYRFRLWTRHDARYGRLPWHEPRGSRCSAAHSRKPELLGLRRMSCSSFVWN